MNVMQRGFSRHLWPIVISGVVLGFSRLLAVDSNHLVLNVRLSEISRTDSTLIVRETLTNDGTGNLWILRWRVPWSGRMEAALFIVKDDYGLPVAYTGVLVKKRAPTIQDFVLLKSGESLVFNVDLEKYYRIDPEKSYSIAADPLLMVARQAVGNKILGSERPIIECNGLVANAAP